MIRVYANIGKVNLTNYFDQRQLRTLTREQIGEIAKKVINDEILDQIADEGFELILEGVVE